MSFNKTQLRKDTKELNKAKAPKKSRDIIYDPAGQWKFPGQNTRIPGSNITMQGVPYPVLAQPNVGQPQMMYPGQDYVFPGASYVDEQPQMKKGGRPRGLVPMPKPSKKGLASKAYSRSLEATNKLFTENYLFKKPKDRRRKVFDPNAKYYQDGGEYGMPLGTGVSQNFIGNRDEFKVGGIPELPLRDNQVNYDAYVNRFEPKTRLYEDGGYIETELTDEEIQAYRDGGYIVEDISVPSLNQMQDGGENNFYTVKGSKGIYRKVNGKWEVDWNKTGNFQPLSKGDVKKRTEQLNKNAEPLLDPDYNTLTRKENFKYTETPKTESKKKLTESESKAQDILAKDFNVSGKDKIGKVEEKVEKDVADYIKWHKEFYGKEPSQDKIDRSRENFSNMEFAGAGVYNPVLGEFKREPIPTVSNKDAQNFVAFDETPKNPGVTDYIKKGYDVVSNPLDYATYFLKPKNTVSTPWNMREYENKLSKFGEVDPVTDNAITQGIDFASWFHPVGAVAQGLKMIPNTVESIESAVENPTLSNIGSAALETGINTLSLLPGVKYAKEGAKYLNKGYNKVATGNSSLPIAWKVEKPAMTPKSSEYIARTYTDREAELLSKYGKGMNFSPEEWKEMEALVKSGATDFSKANIPISRIPLYYTRSQEAIKEAEEISKLKLWQKFKTPTEKNIRTWSAGVPEGYSPERLARSKPNEKIRLVIPSKYTKNLGNDFAGMPYSDKRLPFIWNPETGKINSVAVAEKELMGNIPEGFKVIGKSNEEGMQNIIIKPIKKSASLKESLKNTYKYNPFAGKLGEYNRLVGPNAIEDLLESGLVRAGDYGGSSMPGQPSWVGKRTTPYPSFGKGIPTSDNVYAQRIIQEGKTPYVISTNRPMRVSTLGSHGKGSTQFPVDEANKYMEAFPASEAEIFEFGEPHWFQGYKKVKAPKASKQLPGSPNAIETPSGFQNRVFDTNIQLGEFKGKGHLSEKGYNYRTLGDEEIKAIREFKAVLPKKGKAKGGNENVKYWTKGNEKNWYAENPDQQVIRVNENKFSKDKVVDANDVEIYNHESGAFEPIISKKSNKPFMDKVKAYFDRPPGPLMLGMSKGAVFNKEIKNPDYFLDLMKINKYSPKNKKYFEDLIATVKRQGNVASEKQYEELQRLKTGDMNYGKKGFAKGGIVSELSKKEIKDLAMRKFVNGGTNDCPDGYIKDENGNCIPANYNPNVVNENTEFLKSMANSPLFVERYARMVGKPLEEVTQEAEDYRKQILQNLETVQMGDSAYPPQPYKMGNIEAAAYYSPMADLDKYSKSLNDVQSLINKLPNKGKRNKELRASYQTIYDEAKKNYDEQLRTGHKLYFDVNEWDQPTDLHERSHASVKGNLQVANPYKHKDFSKEEFNFMKEHLETRYPEDKKWYYEDDDEIKARKDIAAKIMMKLGLYDPINENFTPEHYKKLRKLMGSGELDIDTERQLEDITRPFTEEETIRMFNDIVQNDSNDDIQYGKYGGGIVSELSKKKINELVAQGYIVEEVD